MIVVGSAATFVQALGPVRWPFAVPELTRRHVAAKGLGAATRDTIPGHARHAPRLVAASVLSVAVLPAWSVNELSHLKVAHLCLQAHASGR